MTFTREQLVAWRLRQGLTQDQAAAWYGLRAKTRARTWRRWEAGDSPIPDALVKRIRDLSPNGGKYRGKGLRNRR